jgi:hypothetical protein
VFGKKITKRETKKITKREYDSTKLKPVLHCSICTGEQVAGFKNLENGKFEEIMLINSEKDLEAFKQMYGVTQITKEY